MTLLELCERIEGLEVATAIRESTVLFPAIESIHVIAITLVVGFIAMVDLRLLGLAFRREPVTHLTSQMLPWTWGAFVLAAITGLLLFSSVAVRYYENGPFRFKVLLLLLAGINMAVFHSTTYRRVAGWDLASPPPAARVAGGLSIALWIGVVAFGRWVGFT